MVQPDELREATEPCGAVPGPSAEAFDPVLEVFKRDMDFTLVEKNLRLSTEQRAQQLVNFSFHYNEAPSSVTQNR